MITISDRFSRGESEDKSGPALHTKLTEWRPSVQISEVQCVPDEADVIRRKVEQVNSYIHRSFRCLNNQIIFNFISKILIDIFSAGFHRL